MRTKRTKPAARRPRYQPRVEPLEERRLLNAGSLDFGFGHDGLVIADQNATVRAVAVGGDGKIVVLDQTATGYDLVRLNADGSLDTSFGTNGIVAATFGNNTTVVNLAVLGDDSIVVGGEHSSGTVSDVDVARFNSDGSADTAFGNGGIAEVTAPGGLTAADMAAFGDGSVVVLGASGNALAIVRFNADGSLDSGFGTNDVVVTALGDAAQVGAVAVQANGDVVVTGYGNGDLAVLRYNPDGSLDDSFGTGGIVTATLPGATFEGSRVAIDGTSGAIVVTADSFTSDPTYGLYYGQEYFNLFRFNGDGSADTHFGKQGQVSSSTWDYVPDHLYHDLALAAHGQILVGWDSYGAVDVTRYNANGSVDLAFGNGGVLTSLWSDWWSSNQPMPPAIAVQSDGDILVASQATNWEVNGSQEVVLSRFEGHGSLRPEAFGSGAELKEYLIDQAVEQYAGYFGIPYRFWPIFWGDVRGIDAPLLDDASGSATLGSTGNTYSQTNTQVQGVDEGDTVKTDGQYLYVLDGNKLVILNAWPANQLQIVSQTTLDGNSVAEYLDGNHLTVISQISEPYFPFDLEGADRAVWWGWSQPEVHVTVYDISDPSNPQLVQESKLDGYYDNSRAIGDTVYVAVNSYLNLPPPDYMPGGTWESEVEYRARLEAMPLSELLPNYTTHWIDASGAHDTSGLLVNPGAIYQPSVDGDLNLMSVVSFDMTAGQVGPLQSAGFLTDSNATLYAATDNFYLISSRWSDFSGWTQIDRLSLQGGGIQLTAAGRVPGTILNQFSVGEDGPYFDMAVTDGWGSDATNSVYVLGAKNGVLNIIGRLDDLAPGEQIYSVWFMGDRGFVSTFHQVDPLFALDLSNPSAPRVAGKLEVAGYTGYLQALDANHLLGIGQEVDAKTNEPTGLVISLFDVSDLDHPRLVSRYKVAPDGWAWSQALYDYHAITYYPQFQALALPVSSEQFVRGPDGGQYVYQTDQLVFHVDLAGGTLGLLGTVSDSSEIQRGVFINDVLYSISYSSVQAHSLNDLSTLIAQVPLPSPQYYYWWWWWGRPVAFGGGVDVYEVVAGGLPGRGLVWSSGVSATVETPPHPAGHSTGGSDATTSTVAASPLPTSTPSSLPTVVSAQAPESVGTGSVAESAPTAATGIPVHPVSAGTTASESGGGGQEADPAPPLVPDSGDETPQPILEDGEEMGDLAVSEGLATEADPSPRLVDAVFSEEHAATPVGALAAVLLLAGGSFDGRSNWFCRPARRDGTIGRPR